MKTEHCAKNQQGTNGKLKSSPRLPMKCAAFLIPLYLTGCGIFSGAQSSREIELTQSPVPESLIQPCGQLVQTPIETIGDMLQLLIDKSGWLSECNSDKAIIRSTYGVNHD